MTTELNGYGLMAQAHMAEHLPARYATIDNPHRYFATVGEEVLGEINRAMAAWERTQHQPIDPGLRNMTWQGIEAMVLAETVFLTPEQDPSEPEVDQSGAWTGPTPTMEESGDWTPTWGGLTGEEWEEMDEETTRAG